MCSDDGVRKGGTSTIARFFPGKGRSWNRQFLELPIMVAACLNFTKNSGLVLSAGPYVAYGVGGKTSVVVEKKIPTIVGFETVEDEYKLGTLAI